MPDNRYSWHEHSRAEGLGQVLGPHDGINGYPMLESSVTLQWAREKYGDVIVGGEIPITIPVPTDPTT